MNGFESCISRIDSLNRSVVHIGCGQVRSVLFVHFFKHASHAGAATYKVMTTVMVNSETDEKDTGSSVDLCEEPSIDLWGNKLSHIWRWVMIVVCASCHVASS
ncbi:hypothetical protein BATDEDRAFT_23854 [Batrachochytrium dendrobatidis JAM81]|uniref:Uncharacterized protein n=1 Tax=Batrachochytrium dendrobatidis (strain JAM81 / FGSC 10211) TaxID=684364 RepID=F4NZG4_BATDJ|nr:uncharacterized protein BATDEDRAFT_23854 [Batrachochytrium dendrobatidis JAM81]EGF81432.1 hypothetical protein BATDEDRAFT_23854 [Batrachochytrium dendrobatidis JAM81]|eukprot:XP_006677857.1 hypothetical protein BATDEDRAFT_23854 [Batrachochytrium dendrobatidis JAM81]